MGRFETTAATYAAYRELYPPAFFAEAAEALRLTGREALIDLGTGPGLLALGFAPYVSRIVGVDPEPAMLAEARAAAARTGVDFPLTLGRAEEVDLGRFDIVTIGRALHWMEREATLAALDRMLAPGGRILICGATSRDANPWHAAYGAVLKAWGDGREGRHRRVHEHFFDGSRYIHVGDVQVEYVQETSVEALIARALTRSTSSPAVLGDRLEAFRADLRAALAPWFEAGAAAETLVARGVIFERANGE
jgi:SAM-dependent methyltransferase